ncbi:hypothetical protein [Neoroseomonas oryzicola]|uniref:Uncharacterized protein n=1 Tax=Neoroseomonas oryzicola TaxID=535904 RepID=A0A9X9WM21_9PROT|nr:hypothetical protein [Neoroseomonas oryzicola]MBR0661381.1 hypothetical protein [Neoroseomonas oryzicola]NKE17452.1 hypothetical protein [Neoroseomonas oryzicola]
MSGANAAEQRRLTHAVAAASDEALARVVAVFDRMADRREADRLLDAARPRLRRLRPPRPISFARLLFLPLDGAIVDPRAWNRKEGTLPRSALLPIGTAMQEALGAEAAAIEEVFAGATFADAAAIERAGRRLWRAAAAAAVAMPPQWEASGLGPADFRHCAALSAGVWRHADALWAALALAAEGPPEPMVRDAIAAAAGEDPMVIEAMIATILLKAARPGTVAAAAAASRAAPPGSAERVLDRWLEGCTPDLPAGDAAGAARLAEAFAEAIEDLDASPMVRRPERRQRVAALRRQVDEACRAAFVDATTQSLIEPMARNAGRIDDGAMMQIERTARSIRRLEQAGRALGGATAYDAALRRVTDAFGALRAAPGANPADLARLTEILAGPEAALRLLDG